MAGRFDWHHAFQERGPRSTISPWRRRMGQPGARGKPGSRHAPGPNGARAADSAGSPSRIPALIQPVSVEWRPFFRQRKGSGMAKVLATEIRPGNLIEWDKHVWRVLKSHHVHVGGRGGAFMQVEMKDIESGTKRNERIRTEDKIERAFVDQREMQYLYSDGTDFVFMDKDSFEQLTLPADFLEGQAGYLMPNADVQVNFHNDRPIGVQIPSTVTLTVIETEPNLKGATATGSFKPAKTETGVTVMVPQFVA